MKDESKYIRFDHAAANTDAVPFVDEKIYTMRDKEQLIASALSSRDTEIREVLEGLVVSVIDGENCWCPDPFSADNEKHDDACLAARGLWERVNLTEPSD